MPAQHIARHKQLLGAPRTPRVLFSFPKTDFDDGRNRNALGCTGKTPQRPGFPFKWPYPLCVPRHDWSWEPERKFFSSWLHQWLLLAGRGACMEEGRLGRWWHHGLERHRKKNPSKMRFNFFISISDPAIRFLKCVLKCSYLYEVC